ncbi:MAG: ATP-dependent sacrificial sulfur transferase LarE [Oscillospiraceae bacterium]|nr:ATP-dependent sacrificial sulfur transferase LarE [Oscillospiraceae bacterium]
MDIYEKKQALEDYLKCLGSVAVAFSSGVDSAFLLKIAHDVLGDDTIAITARSEFFPERETREAAEFCKKESIRHVYMDFHALDMDVIVKNPPNRCYYCKKMLFTGIKAAAAVNGARYVCEGSNVDDEGDYRPGLRAVSELGIKSPLREAGLTKAEIRELSKELGLPTWDKPSFACLASRFVYGETITGDKLGMADRAEQYLLDRGFRQMRVRIHGDIARIEVLPEDFEKLLAIAGETEKKFRELGFAYVAMDLGGYKTGSMNRKLQEA